MGNERSLVEFVAIHHKCKRCKRITINNNSYREAISCVIDFVILRSDSDAIFDFDIKNNLS